MDGPINRPMDSSDGSNRMNQSIMEKLSHSVKAVAEIVAYGISKGGAAAERPTDRSARPPSMDMKPDTTEFKEEVQNAKESLGLSASEFNVAVVGAQYSGKSSLINGLRHILDNDNNAAPIGVTNKEPKKYKSSSHSESLTLWEVQGAGLGCPAITYYYDKKLYAYDMLLLVCDRFRRVDLEILRAANIFKQPPYFVVRNKADLALVPILQRSTLQTNNDNNNLAPALHSAMKILRSEISGSIRHAIRMASMDPDDVLPSQYLYIVSCKAMLDPHIYHRLISQRFDPSGSADDRDEEDNDPVRMDEESLDTTINNLILRFTKRYKSRKIRS